MATQAVITIGRQFGSGGRQVGKLLAEKLGVPFYDKELITMAAKDSGIGEEIMEEHDEKPVRALLFSMMAGMQMRGDAGGFYMDMPLGHKIFLAQFDAIRTIAHRGPCVIVGRCADYVLRDMPHAVRVFLYADIQRRIQRAISLYNVDPVKAEEIVRRNDKQRQSYYNYYATNTWGAVENYDLCLNTGILGIKGTVDLLTTYVSMHEDAVKAIH